eukprot:IDg11198t1
MLRGRTLESDSFVPTTTANSAQRESCVRRTVRTGNCIRKADTASSLIIELGAAFEDSDTTSSPLSSSVSGF